MRFDLNKKKKVKSMSLLVSHVFPFFVKLNCYLNIIVIVSSLSSLNWTLDLLLLYSNRSVICDIVSTFPVNGLVPVIVCPKSV